MLREVSDKNLLNEFAAAFVSVLDKLKIKYIIVSGFVAISHGRARGTEDIDLIIEKIPKQDFVLLYSALEKTGFECLQGSNSLELYADYLQENLSLRFVKKESFVPEIELKLAKDALDEWQLKNRKKLPMTGLPFYFSSVEANIAFKEELLKSDKDLEDARHLRILYEEKLDAEEIKKVKEWIRKYRL